MADSEPQKPTKRRLKPASQTVRQQAEKAQASASAEKPVRARRLKAAAATGRKPFSRVGKALNRQPFRFLGRILVPRFVRGSFAELKAVTWPTFKETRQLTFAVLAFAVVFGIIITAVDYGLDKLFRAFIIK